MLKKVKNDIINSIIDDIVQFEKSDAIKESKRIELIQKINSKNIISNFSDNSVDVNATAISTNSKSLYIDLLTTFGLMKELDATVEGYRANNVQVTESIITKCKELLDRIYCCKESMSDRYIPEIIVENFQSAISFDKINRKFHTDRYGQLIPIRCYATYVDGENIVTLPLIRRDNSLLYGGIVETADISLRFQLGRGFIDYTDDTYDINNIINGSTNSWSQTILSDKEFDMSFLEKRPEKIYVDDNYFYYVNNGAVAELEINFESVNTVNEIVINPYCKYPIDIVSIRYKMTDDEEEPLIELVYPDNENKHLSEKFTKDKISFRFPDILCKKIFILFTQRHYERGLYLYNTHDVYKNALWLNSTTQHEDINENVIFEPIYHDRDKVAVGWESVNDSVVKSSEDLTNILIGDQNKARKVKKYEYQYGFHDIACNNNHFDKIGYFITKEITLKSNAKLIEIYTDEEHPKGSNGSIVTDFEYYITGSKDPSRLDWLPIFPANKDIIESELLFIQNGTMAWFRFETEDVFCIMKNGEELPNNTAEYHLKINDATGMYCGVQIFNYDYDAVYSVKYRPHFTSKYINLDSNVTTSVESFKSNGEAFVTLSEKPYIDKDNNYCMVSVSNIEGKYGTTTVIAQNVTDPYNPYASYENLDKTTFDLQFYVLDNTIYFNKEIEDGSIIDVTYNHLITKIRTKVLIRRNTTKDSWLSPSLNSIKYKIQSK